MSADQFQLYDRDEPVLSEFERTLFDSVSRSKPWDLVERFADLHREPGTDDERAAAHYLERRFEEYGIPFERYEPEFWIGEPRSAALRVVSPHREDLDTETDRPAIKAQSFSGSASVQGEFCQLELPEAASVQELRGASLEDLGEADREFEGKVVVVDQPILSRTLIMELEARNAAAYVLVHPHPEEPHYGVSMPVWGAIPRPEQREMIPEIPILNVARDVGDRLSALAAGDELLALEVETDVPRRWVECPLVVAEVPGEADPRSDDFVLLHGHYDSYDAGVTDNATGNAGMVECARVLNDHRDRLRRDLRIAFWPAHEGGRYGGSTWFVDQFAHELYDHCVAHVNFDSPGVKDATEFEEMTVWMAEADPLCRGAIDDVAGKDSTENRPRRSGDYSFYNLGVTGMLALSSSIPREVRDARGYHPVSGSGGDSEAWHLSTNTLDKADPDVLVRDIRVYLVVLARLLSAPVVPLDYRRTVANHLTTIQEYHEAAGDHFDLSPVLEELRGLKDELETFYAIVDAGAVSEKRANKTLRRLSRILVPLDFTENGRFEQDPAMYRPPYPSLADVRELENLEGDEYRFRTKTLVRDRNEVVHQLRTARRELQA
ncbi:M28 family peptidase [Halorubrum luteum]